MPSASRSLLAAGPGVAALRDAAARLNEAVPRPAVTALP